MVVFGSVASSLLLGDLDAATDAEDATKASSMNNNDVDLLFQNKDSAVKFIEVLVVEIGGVVARSQYLKQTKSEFSIKISNIEKDKKYPKVLSKKGLVIVCLDKKMFSVDIVIFEQKSLYMGLSQQEQRGYKNIKIPVLSVKDYLITTVPQPA